MLKTSMCPNTRSRNHRIRTNSQRSSPRNKVYSAPHPTPIAFSLTLALTGALHHIGDPLGKGLETVLKPVGAPLGAVTGKVGDTLGGATKPVLGPFVGSKDEKMEALGGDNKDSYVHGKDTVGGHLQAADNPLPEARARCANGSVADHFDLMKTCA